MLIRSHLLPSAQAACTVRKEIIIVYFLPISYGEGQKSYLCLFHWTSFNDHPQGCYGTAWFELCFLISWGTKWAQLLAVRANAYFERYSHTGIWELALALLGPWVELRDSKLRGVKRNDLKFLRSQRQSCCQGIWHGRDHGLWNTLFYLC